MSGEPALASTGWGGACVEVETWKNPKGYGVTCLTVGRNSRVLLLAHRIAFEKAWGITLRADQVVRHTCDNPPCVNPLHLMVGTQGDNVRDAVERGSLRSGGESHCINGHEFNDANTYRDNNGYRYCRACRKQRHADMRRTQQEGYRS